ncbi:MAG TPA: DEAD/DEAH box helicase [Candidatus Paceibacterota bacterium]|nr:DEAD/DEAH box helicase [Candidatus Paceibacterota bacterium]
MATTYIRRLDGRKPPRGASWAAQFESKPRRSRGGRPQSGSQGNRSQGSRSDHGNRSSGSRGRKNYQEMDVDLSKLINKAKPGEEEAPYVPDLTFADLPIDERLKENIITKGYLLPTPIQDKSIPQVLMGHDVVGLANTGTGKTASFLIPLINRVIFDRTQRMLIMVPTRELALQIEAEFYGFTKRLNINAVTCVGGAAIEPQVRVLRRQPNFVIGTPGRLKDFIDRGELDLSTFGTVVLDEADRMLDMGFIGDMREIIALMPKKRHTLFFSATMDRNIEKLVGEFLNDPVRISVKTRDTAATIDQDVVYFPSGQKFEKLVEILKQPDMDKVLVFGRTKHGVDRLARDLSHAGIKAEAIHGDLTHGRRQKALGLFKQDQVKVLVATDVAARGLDISGVSHVINYDLPGTYEDYTHRIGRTGRAGKTGKALTFISQ